MRSEGLVCGSVHLLCLEQEWNVYQLTGEPCGQISQPFTAPPEFKLAFPMYTSLMDRFLSLPWQDGTVISPGCDDAIACIARDAYCGEVEDWILATNHRQTRECKDGSQHF